MTGDRAYQSGDRLVFIFGKVRAEKLVNIFDVGLPIYYRFCRTEQFYLLLGQVVFVFDFTD